MYTAKAKLVEDVILSGYAKKMLPYLNHEFIYDVDLDDLVASVKALIPVADLSVQIVDNIAAYNELEDGVLAEVARVKESAGGKVPHEAGPTSPPTSCVVETTFGVPEPPPKPLCAQTGVFHMVLRSRGGPLQLFLKSYRPSKSFIRLRALWKAFTRSTPMSPGPIKFKRELQWAGVRVVKDHANGDRVFLEKIGPNKFN